MDGLLAFDVLEVSISFTHTRTKEGYQHTMVRLPLLSIWHQGHSQASCKALKCNDESWAGAVDSTSLVQQVANDLMRAKYDNYSLPASKTYKVSILPMQFL